MIGQIGKLKIPIEGYYFAGKREGSDEREDAIPNMRKINLFIGANNSGKSRLIRAIATAQIEYVPRWLDISVVHEKLKQLSSKINESFSTDFLQAEGVRNILKEIIKLSEQSFVSQGQNRSAPLRGLLSSRVVQHNQTFSNKMRQMVKGEELEAQLKNIIEEGLRLDHLTILDYFDVRIFRRLYVPVVRGLRRFGGANDIIELHFRNEYFSTNVPGLEIVTGHDFYETVKGLRLGNYEERMRLQRYEEFLSKAFFSDKRVDLISHDRDKVLHIKIGREHQRPIHELGDGLQSLIVMTYQVCLKQGMEGFVMVEEPELYLHPGALRSFVTAILEDELFSHYQFFFATHSNHLLDLALDYTETATYSVHKAIANIARDEIPPEFKIESEDYGSEQSLSYLGVRNSSVYLANCTIWVEGVTDRWYIRKYLSLIPESQGFKSYIEDLHYSIVEYAGSNVTHWSFLKKEDHPINVDRLCGKAFVIMDKDDSEAKTKRQEEVKEIIGDRLIVLPVREIENTLTPAVLKLVVREYARKLENTDAFDGFVQADYRDVHLAPFIDSKIDIKHKFTGEYGVLTGKTKFCEHALPHLNSWDDLSGDAQNLALAIAEFIKGSNA